MKFIANKIILTTLLMIATQAQTIQNFTRAMLSQSNSNCVTNGTEYIYDQCTAWSRD